MCFSFCSFRFASLLPSSPGSALYRRWRRRRCRSLALATVPALFGFFFWLVTSKLYWPLAFLSLNLRLFHWLTRFSFHFYFYLLACAPLSRCVCVYGCVCAVLCSLWLYCFVFSMFSLTIVFTYFGTIYFFAHGISFNYFD